MTRSPLALTTKCNVTSDDGWMDGLQCSCSKPAICLFNNPISPISWVCKPLKQMNVLLCSARSSQQSLQACFLLCGEPSWEVNIKFDPQVASPPGLLCNWHPLLG